MESSSSSERKTVQSNAQRQKKYRDRLKAEKQAKKEATTKYHREYKRRYREKKKLELATKMQTPRKKRGRSSNDESCTPLKCTDFIDMTPDKKNLALAFHAMTTQNSLMESATKKRKINLDADTKNQLDALETESAKKTMDVEAERAKKIMDMEAERVRKIMDMEAERAKKTIAMDKERARKMIAVESERKKATIEVDVQHDEVQKEQNLFEALKACPDQETASHLFSQIRSRPSEQSNNDEREDDPMVYSLSS